MLDDNASDEEDRSIDGAMISLYSYRVGPCGDNSAKPYCVAVGCLVCYLLCHRPLPSVLLTVVLSAV